MMTFTPVIWLNIALLPAEGFPMSAILLGAFFFKAVLGIDVVRCQLRSFFNTLRLPRSDAG
jgi:hypothetical protein